jgi:hypothetical protein
MLGFPAQWAQEGLAGIDQTRGSAGYRSLLIRPAVFTGPATVTATRETPQGTVRVSWHRSGATARVTVTVPAGAHASVVLPSGTHAVGAGTATFTTGLGTRSSFGAKPFLVPGGRIVKVPWNQELWASVAGAWRHLTWAEWQATGFRHPAAGLPVGSVVYRNAVGGTSVLLPDGRRHRLTTAEWAALGKPAPQTVR